MAFSVVDARLSTISSMIFETSMQAKFLIPMAISLGFGILFVTVIVLLIVPALYVWLERIRYRMGYIELNEIE